MVEAANAVSNPNDSSSSSSQEANALASEAQTAPTDSAPKPLVERPRNSPVVVPHEVPRSRSESRRSNKPYMEKKRRQRINHALTLIKDDLLQETAAKRDPRHAKLEKADILEMAVRALKEARMKKMNMEHELGDKFLAGYELCVRDVSRFFDRIGVDPTIRNSLLAHLKREQKSSSIPPRPMTTPSPLAARPMTTPSPLVARPMTTPSPLAAAAATPRRSYYYEPPRPMAIQSPNARIQADPASLNGLRLMPTLLASGEFALLMPASQARLFNNTMAVPCSPSPTCTVSSPFSAPSTSPPLYYNGLLQHAMTPPGLPPINLNLSMQARSIGHFISPSQEEPLPLVKRAWQPWC
ncbi:transcription factor HES-4-like [Cloeon dipterum]|uniref:transcription factor HES-4-like n=1 Tax=Cloeon dipterum TaxID=197152 RepID=UPI0032202F03